MTIQKYIENDLTILATIYQAAILKLGTNYYTQEQLQIWSNWANEPHFKAYLQNGEVFVAIKNDRIVSFGQLFPKNHIALLYTHPDYARQGLAQKIYFALEQTALKYGETHLSVAASKISKPFFERVGFSVIEEEIAIRQSVKFLRYKMHKKLII